MTFLKGHDCSSEFGDIFVGGHFIEPRDVMLSLKKCDCSFTMYCNVTVPQSIVTVIDMYALLLRVISLP